MDSFEEVLDLRLKDLKECQNSLGLESCYHCDKLFECELRKNYVDSVYNSMSKGKIDGGFDF